MRVPVVTLVAVVLPCLSAACGSCVVPPGTSTTAPLVWQIAGAAVLLLFTVPLWGGMIACFVLGVRRNSKGLKLAGVLLFVSIVMLVVMAMVCSVVVKH